MSKKKTFVGRAYEAWCVDCDWRYVGDLAEARKQLAQHREKTGHKG